MKKSSPDNLDISVDPSSGVPLWLQLRNQLIFHIDAGHFDQGYRLPTVREMAVILGINYNTVGKVYQGLEHDGYIVSMRGKGTFVSKETPQDADGPIEQGNLLADEFIRQCRELGMDDQYIQSLVRHRLSITTSEP